MTTDILERYNDLIEQRNFLKKEKGKYQKKIKKLSGEIQNYKDTRAVLNEAVKIVHQKFKSEIESVITRSIQTIFNRNFLFELQYEEKRNGIESNIVILEDREEIDPKTEMGGSVVDIVSSTFRFILWWISSPRPRNTFILDEPYRFLGDYMDLAGMILKELSQVLGFQVILITHDKRLLKYADRIFHVSLKDKKSIVIQRKVK